MINEENELLNLITQMNDDERADIISRFELVDYPKNSFLLEQGKVENYLYFIISGMVRVYTTTRNKESILFFRLENDYFSSFGSFVEGSPSELSVQAIEDISAMRISKENITELYDKYHKIERLGRIYTENFLIETVNYYSKFLELTSEERYLYLYKNKKEYIKRIPIKYLSTYLGIHPNSLSRIRRKIKIDDEENSSNSKPF